MAFIGDGASNQGTVAESLNFAAVLEAADDLHVREQRLCRVHGPRYHLRRRGHRGARGGLRHARPRRWTASTSSRSTTPSAARSRVRATATARAPSRPSPIRWYGHFEGDMQKYRESKRSRPACARPPIRWSSSRSVSTPRFRHSGRRAARDRRGDRGTDRGQGRRAKAGTEADQRSAVRRRLRELLNMTMK